MLKDKLVVFFFKYYLLAVQKSFNSHYKREAYSGEGRDYS